MDGLEPVPAGAKRDRTLPDVVQGLVRSAGADEAQIPLAVVGGRLATDLVDLTDDLAALESQGFWAVVLPFDRATGVRAVRQRPPGAPLARAAVGGSRTGCVDELAHRGRVHGRRGVDPRVHRGGRRVPGEPHPSPLRAPAAGADVAALGAALADGNPAPYSAVVRIPAVGCHVASASPERFLSRDGDIVESRPIKGTAPTPSGLTEKDRAENVMIVDLVRNDLGRVCEFGSVEVPDLLALEHHPGLVHLVSTVRGRLRPGRGWADAIAATFPPGSVTGAPKLAALDHIAALEPVPRGVYCGAVGWVDADRKQGDLNVAIRTFWVEDEQLHLGTGGGITWGSDPLDEWEETELKARQLLRVASGSVHA